MKINSNGKSRFKVSKQNLPAFEKLCAQFVAKTQSELKCLFYGFSFCGDLVHCREGYSDADGLLAQLQMWARHWRKRRRFPPSRACKFAGRRRNWQNLAARSPS